MKPNAADVCTAKERFASRSAARAAVAGMVRRRDRRRRRNLATYYCALCGGYHVSSGG